MLIKQNFTKDMSVFEKIWDDLFKDVMNRKDFYDYKFRHEFENQENQIVVSKQTRTVRTIEKNEKGYLLKVEVPGYESKDISIDFEEGHLNLSWGNNSIKYKVTSDVDETKISAETKNGILYVNLPFKEVKKENKIKIEVK